MVALSEILEVLRDADLPMDKRNIIETAHRKNARSEILEVLATLPDTEYRSLAGIWDGLGRNGCGTLGNGPEKSGHKN